MKRKHRKHLLLLLSILLALIVIFAGYKVITILLEYKTGKDTYDTMQQYIYIDTTQTEKSSVVPPESDAELDEADKLIWPEVDFEALQAINPDVIAWIYIEGTQINYPVLQGATNNTYLRRLLTGEYNTAGSIFMDYRNAADFSDQNTILYGHNMDNGTMFADILRYQEQDWYEAHSVGQILTPDGNYTVSFFSGYVTDVLNNAWERQFFSEADFAEWLDTSAERSCFASETVPDISNRIVTLSTCSYAFNDARFVLVGILEPAP